MLREISLVKLEIKKGKQLESHDFDMGSFQRFVLKFEAPILNLQWYLDR